MPVSGYFNNFPSQQRMTGESLLMESIIDESIQIMGQNIYYIPRESIDNADFIFGESTKVRFEHAYLIETYITNVEGFEGDKDFFSKFGLEIRNNSNFIISRRGFTRIMPTSLRPRPQEGDILWVPLLHRMFEIKFVEKNLMFYSLGKRLPYVYELRCEEFRYSQEDFDTGVEEIDEIEQDVSFTQRLTMVPLVYNFADYQPGEVVYQSNDGTVSNSSASAEVTAWYKANNSLFVRQVAGTFTANTIVYGDDSGAEFKFGSYNNDEDHDKYDLRDNEEFDNDTTLILDLSELNPFGSP
jgi:hypothetical protein